MSGAYESPRAHRRRMAAVERKLGGRVPARIAVLRRRRRRQAPVATRPSSGGARALGHTRTDIAAPLRRTRQTAQAGPRPALASPARGARGCRSIPGGRRPRHRRRGAPLGLARARRHHRRGRGATPPGQPQQAVRQPGGRPRGDILYTEFFSLITELPVNESSARGSSSFSSARRGRCASARYSRRKRSPREG